MGFELAGVSWSEFAAGTLRAQLGYFRGGSGKLNLAETRVFIGARGGTRTLTRETLTGF